MFVHATNTAMGCLVDFSSLCAKEFISKMYIMDLCFLRTIQQYATFAFGIDYLYIVTSAVARDL